MPINVQRLIGDLLDDEGMRLFAYDDATGAALRPGYTLVGHPTIGVGRCLDRKGVTAVEVRLMLIDDLREHLKDLVPFAWFAGLDEVRARAIINMAHQLGVAGVQGFTQMTAALGLRNWQMAHDAALDSLWAKETPARAKRVAYMLATGTDPPDDWTAA